MLAQVDVLMPDTGYTLYLDIDMGSSVRDLTFRTEKQTTESAFIASLGAGEGRGRELIKLNFECPTSYVRYIGLGFGARAAPDLKLYGMRIDTQEELDELGVFSGYMQPTATHVYDWESVPFDSISQAWYAPAPEPEPEPEPESPIVASILVLLGYGEGDDESRQVARESVESIMMMVRAYTRGRGFTVDPETGHEAPSRELVSVIKLASARLMANPSGLTYRAGSEAITDAFKGWTLAETFVLNSYRKRQS